MPRPSTITRHKEAYEYFKLLYDKQRLRYDDSMEKTAKKHHYEVVTLDDIFRELRREEAA